MRDNEIKRTRANDGDGEMVDARIFESRDHRDVGDIISVRLMQDQTDH